MSPFSRCFPVRRTHPGLATLLRAEGRRPKAPSLVSGLSREQLNAGKCLCPGLFEGGEEQERLGAVTRAAGVTLGWLQLSLGCPPVCQAQQFPPSVSCDCEITPVPAPKTNLKLQNWAGTVLKCCCGGAGMGGRNETPALESQNCSEAALAP